MTTGPGAIGAHQAVTKLTILVSHPIQYFAPVFRLLAAREDLDLEVVFHCKVGLEHSYDPGFGQIVAWDIPLLEGFRSRFLSRSRNTGGLKLGIIPALIRRRPDVLMIHGYSSATNLVAIAVGKLLGARVLLRGDTRLMSHHKLHGPKAFMKRILFKLVDGFLYIGSLNREFYTAHGVPDEKLHFAPLSVDNAAFWLPDERRKAERSKIRSRLCIPRDAVVILFASKMVAWKRATDLVRAFSMIAESFPASWLLLVGSGPDESRVRELASHVPEGRVRFMGFLNQTEMPSCFAASDVFVLPTSGDPWGLVVNEAMAAGMPVVVSDETGAAPDLVRDSGAGVVYECGDVEALAAALRRLLESACDRTEMSQRAMAHISKWDIAVSAECLARAVVSVAGGAGPLRRAP
jgi:glycosyltransferase involved in cell wall biosynthesis